MEKPSLFRHPLTIVFTSFFLTVIVGTLFGLWISSNLSEAERLRLLAENQKTIVQNFSRYLAERRSRAELLASSFKRNAPLEEIKYRKKLYDESYVNWNANHLANLLLIRDILDQKTYTEFESIIDQYLVKNILKPLDACLTNSYDARIQNKNPLDVYDKCNGEKLLRQTLDCGYSITNELYKLAGKATDKHNAINEIISRCPLQ